MPSKVYFADVATEPTHPAGETDVERIAGIVRQLFIKSGLSDTIEKGDFVGIKIHFGEEGNTGHIKSEWVKPIIEEIRKKTRHIFLTDTNTLYKGNRSNSIDHMELASRHGFSLAGLGVPVIIADGLTGRDYGEVLIEKNHFRSVKIAREILNADMILNLAHVTGHCQSGLAAALKNLGMGCASRAGKLAQHSDVLPEVTRSKCKGCGLCLKWCPKEAIVILNGKANISGEKCIGCGECTVVCRNGAIGINWDTSLKALQERMIEYAYGVIKAKERRVSSMNFLIHVTKDCDCMTTDEPPVISDIGILASTDTVAIDRAAADLVNARAGKDKFRESYPEIDWQVQLDYAAALGIGNLEYTLINISSAL